MAGAIRGVTIQFQADATKLNKELRNISSSTSKIDRELRGINTALKFNPTSVEHWRKKQELLTSKIGDTKRKLEILKNEQKAMTAAGVEKTSESYRALQREIVETNSKLKAFKTKLIEVGNVKLKALSEGLKSIGSKLSTAGRTLTTSVTLPLTLMGGAAAKNFAEIDKIMTLTNSTMGNTAEQAELLDKAMKEAAANSTYGMTDAATATLNFARAGLDAEQSAAALAPAMNLAAGEGGNLDTVSGGLVATINGFHGSFDDAAHYADVFANACNNSALDVDSLSNAMSVAAPIFSAAGYSVEDAALYMGIMANNGIDANKAANSLKTGMARLVSPASDGAKAMEDLGISITDADGNMKDTITIQKELHDAFANLSESEQIAAASAIFGKNQMSPWLALINSAPDSVDDLSKSLQDEGTATEMASDMMSGFGGTIEKLKSSVDVASASLGEALAPVIEKVVGWIQTAVDWFNSLDSETQTIIATIGVVVAALGPVLLIVGKLLSSIGSIIGAISSVSTALTLMNPAILTTVGIVAGVIAAIIALWIIWKKYGDKIKAKVLELKDWIVKKWTEIKTKVTETVTALKDKVVTTWNNLKQRVIDTINGIKTTALLLWTALKVGLATIVQNIKAATIDKFIALWNRIAEVVQGIKESILNRFRSIWERVAAIVQGIKDSVLNRFRAIWDRVASIVQGIKDSILTRFNSLWERLASIVSGIKDSILTRWTNIKTSISDTVQSIKDKVTGVWDSLVSNAKEKFDSIKSTAVSIWEGIKSAITDPIQTAWDFISGVIDKIKSAFSGLTVSLPNIKLPHFTINPPGWSIGDLVKGTIPSLGISWYKTGGIFDHPSVIGVGEAGPEAVIPINKLRDLLGDVSGSGVVVNVYGSNNMSVDELAQAVESRLISMQKRRKLAW